MNSPHDDFCPQCEGDGMVFWHPPDVPFSQTLAGVIDCSACGGTGRRGEDRPPSQEEQAQ